MRQYVIAAECDRCRCEQDDPNAKPERSGSYRVEVVDTHLARRGAGLGDLPDAQEAHQRGREHDRGERHGKQENGDEGCRANEPVEGPLQGAPCDAEERLHDDGEDRRLDPDEDRRDERHAAEGRIQQRKRQDDERARQYEQKARRQAALHTVKPPADVGRQLHRLGPGNSMQKLRADR